jgi:hypothetical protein
MALKRPKGPSGTLVLLEHTSKILKDNPLGDPHVRKLAVWLPPHYDDGAGKRRFPVLYDPVSRTPTGNRSATTYRSARRGSSASRKWGR